MNALDGIKRISVKEGRNRFVFVYKDGGIIINGYKLAEAEPDMKIPEKIGNRKVIGIAEHAFEDCTSLRSVYMAGGIGQIGFRAFFGCANLEKVIFPETLKIIKWQAFYDCNNLKELHLPKKLLIINDSAFYGCKRLKKVVFPDNLEIIRCSSFDHCSSLEFVVFSANLKELGSGAFSNCGKLREVKFSDQMTPQALMNMKVGRGVFQNDPLLEDTEGNVIVGNVMFGHNGSLLDSFEISDRYLRVLDLFSYSPIVYRKNTRTNMTANTSRETIVFDAISRKQEGDIITVGLFPQNKDLIPEPIEWKVIKREGNILTLITEKAIMKMNYHNGIEEVYWNECTLRQWLNGPFFDFAFREEEKRQICPVTIYHKTRLRDDGKRQTLTDSTDLVSILTTEEAETLSKSIDLKAVPTAYARAMFIEWTHTLGSWCYDTSDRETVWWWLRSLFPKPSPRVPSVTADGLIRDFVYSNDYVYDQVTFVRPVIRIQI